MESVKKIDGFESNGVSLVVTAILNANAAHSINEYIDGTLPQLIAAGGKIRKRVMVDEVIHGKSSGLVVIMDFDSEDTIRSVFNSEEYKRFIPVRNVAFQEINIQIAKNM